MADLDLDAIASRPGDGAIFLANWERDALVAEVRRLRDALNNRDAAWEARLQQAHDDGDLNCDPWDIWPSEATDG